MRLDEIFGLSFGKKKEPELKRTDITPEERAMIVRAFDKSSNANLKKGDGEYVLPQNVTLVFGRGYVNFYKDGDQLIAGIGWYGNDTDPGDPKKAPITHSEKKINKQSDLYDLKDELLDGLRSSSTSHDSLRYQETKRDLHGKV